MNFLEKINKPKLIFWSFIIGISWGITPYMFHLADLERGYDATGGELFTPLFPLMVCLLISAVKDVKEVGWFE